MTSNCKVIGTAARRSRIGTCAGLLFVFLCCWAALSCSEAHGQASFSISPEQLQKLTPEQRKQVEEQMRKQAAAAQPVAQPTQNKKKEEKKKDDKAEKKQEGKENEEEAKVIERPTDGSQKLDPNRIRLQPDENGLVQFNYNGHPWKDVMQDYADAAGLTFEWQKLPADNVILTTQRKYRLDEARDLLNRLLLARGFTAVLQGELLMVVKLDKLDPSLVPRVEADDLEDYLPHDFVRVRFDLPHSMEPDRAKEDIKQVSRKVGR